MFKRKGWILAIGFLAIGLVLFFARPRIIRWVNTLVQGKERIIVAILDTGVDVSKLPSGDVLFQNSRDPVNKEDDDKNGLTDDTHGWNFFEGSPDIKDTNGHGTQIALEVLKVYPTAKILPLKLTDMGAGLDAERFAAAIDYAVGMGAKVINASMGMRTTDDAAVTKALDRARESRVVVVTAVGTGVPNPFRPVAVAELVPQGHVSTLVVGAKAPGGHPDVLSNYGSEIDLVVEGEGSSEAPWSSSMASARITGLIAKLFSDHFLDPRLSPLRIRAMLRSATQPPNSGSDLARSGYGTFREEKVEAAIQSLSGASLQTRFLKAEGATGEFWINAVEEIEELESEIQCSPDLRFTARAKAGAESTSDSSANFQISTGKKGRAYIFFKLDRPNTDSCRLVLRAKLNGVNETQVIEIASPWAAD